ncbi:MAG: DUF3575 domain-containing protein [Cyclobacteriaceae bacterium]
MKKCLLVLTLIGAGILTSNAQVLKINILSPIVKTFNVQYEQAVSASSSFQLGFFYTGFDSDGTKFSGFGITPEYRFYLSDTDAPQGVYVAPFLRYQNFKLEEEVTASEGDFTAIGGGLILGKQWIFKEKIALDLFIGPAYYSGSVDVTSGSDTFDTGAFDGFGLRTGLCFGFKF